VGGKDFIDGDPYLVVGDTINLLHQVVAATPASMFALSLQSGDTDCHRLSLIDPRLSRIVAVWTKLPESVRNAVEAISHDWG
jgi:hypothetical protein